MPSSNFVSAMMIPARQRVLGRRLVEAERDRLDFLQPHFADQLGRLRARDVLVVPLDRLRCGREDRLRELVGLLQALGKLVPADLAARAVVLPARAGEIAAHHALDRQHLEAAALHRAAVVADGEHVVRDDRPEEREPVAGEAGQDAALVRDLGRQDDVEGRDPVGRNEEQAPPFFVIRVDGVDLADLPGRDVGLRHVVAPP